MTLQLNMPMQLGSRGSVQVADDDVSKAFLRLTLHSWRDVLKEALQMHQVERLEATVRHATLEQRSAAHLLAVARARGWRPACYEVGLGMFSATITALTHRHSRSDWA